ncbi:hypothetical protein R5W24_002181 [Gemmata sp. JC717]|uniref:hypothetical protein n=1 Tax=Gemmata algarum TaxID=2975278 RepID=UPI0021BB4601|nr:hypothetical protein [Gemmata algarum]MDY3553090.1 hypothetical protein [Gemmata algarum]
MTERVLKVLPLGVFGSLLVALAAINTAPAQEPIPLRPPGVPQPDPVPLPLPAPGQPAQAGQGDGMEVLAKGPVHEAFASTAEAPTAAPVVAKQPPEPIEELPPDQKPEGDNVQWIPGYWSWDEENGQFIWVSGFWRQPPPGRVWVPGAWRDAKGGWQYVPGFWQEVAPTQPQQPAQPQVQPEIEYLPQPPQSLEIGPTVVAPTATSVYVPGSWVWRNRYVWRPGVWVEHRRDWLWVPARYHWSPAGYVFVDGYWDYPLATRGVLFAPVVFTRPVYARPAFVYTPMYVVSEPCMTGALFVRRGYTNYYFGDYFDGRYVDRGYSAWCGVATPRGGFSIGFGVGRSWGYDPLWSYYSVQHRHSPRWNAGVADIYAGRYRGDVVRPPTTLVQQNTVINKITQTNINNVTNNITVVNGAPTVGNQNVANVAMVAPLKVAPDLQRTKFQAVAAEQRREEAVAARQFRDVAAQRTKLETAVASKPQPVVTPGAGGAAQPAVRPQSIKLDVPKAAVARARVASDDKAPPPNPLRANGSGTPGAGTRIDPKPAAGGGPVNPATNPQPRPPVSPNPVANPATPPQPKVEPKQPAAPTGRPQPKVDPGQPTNPATRPQPVVPKVEPKPAPATNPAPPRVEPKQSTEPVMPSRPKINPTPTPAPANPQPKTEPRPAAPTPVSPAPKVNPPTTPAPRTNPQPTPLPAAPTQPRPSPVPPTSKPLAPSPVAPSAPPRVNPPASVPAPAVQPTPKSPAAPPAAQPAPRPPVQPLPQPAPVAPPASRPVTAQPPLTSPRPTVAPPATPPRPTAPPRSQPPAGKPGKKSDE